MMTNSRAKSCLLGPSLILFCCVTICRGFSRNLSVGLRVRGLRLSQDTEPDLFSDTEATSAEEPSNLWGQSVDINRKASSDANGWGQSVDIRQKPESAEDNDSLWGKSVAINSQNEEPAIVATEEVSPLEELERRKKRNIVVGCLSILIAIFNYGWTFTHPLTPVQLLSDMQSQSAPMSAIGTNGKPTVVDFWAPWCENCKAAAPTLAKVEEEYRDKVNFVMVNGDESKAWPYIEAFGVDAIPHLAIVSADGDVETALIGPIPKSVLEADLNALLDPSEKRPLPFQMLDVFASRPELRRVHFDP